MSNLVIAGLTHHLSQGEVQSRGKGLEDGIGKIFEDFADSTHSFTKHITTIFFRRGEYDTDGGADNETERDTFDEIIT